MTFRGEYRNGVIVPDEPLGYPSGTRLEIGSARRLRGGGGASSRKASAVRPAARASANGKGAKRGSRAGPNAGAMYALLKPIIGKGRGLPADYSTNHDHYLFGAPKRKP